MTDTPRTRITTGFTRISGRFRLYKSQFTRRLLLSELYITVAQVSHFSTREAAKKLGLSHTTLARYIETGKVPTPKTVVTSNTVVHLWTQEEIENVRKLLSKIANGRKTRYQKQREKQATRKSKR